MNFSAIKTDIIESAQGQQTMACQVACGPRVGPSALHSGVARNLAWGAVEQFWLKSLINIEVLYLKG